MESEAKIILAFLFNRSGKTTLTEAELYLPLSMELGWFSTKEAQEFIILALKQSLLKKEGKLLHPTFPVDTIAIPVGFTPSKKVLQEKKVEHHEESLRGFIVSQICEKTAQDQKTIEEEIRHEAEEKDVLPEVAALVVAWRRGVAIAEWLDAVEAVLLNLKGNTG